MEFREIIRRERQNIGKTQKQIAQILGVVESCYANWEQGRTEPDIENIIKLSRIFKVSTDYLFGLEDEMGFKIAEDEGFIYTDGVHKITHRSKKKKEN